MNPVSIRSYRDGIGITEDINECFLYVFLKNKNTIIQAILSTGPVTVTAGRKGYEIDIRKHGRLLTGYKEAAEATNLAIESLKRLVAAYKLSNQFNAFYAPYLKDFDDALTNLCDVHNEQARMENA